MLQDLPATTVFLEPTALTEFPETRAIKVIIKKSRTMCESLLFFSDRNAGSVGEPGAQGPTGARGPQGEQGELVSELDIAFF